MGLPSWLPFSEELKGYLCLLANTFLCHMEPNCTNRKPRSLETGKLV